MIASWYYLNEFHILLPFHCITYCCGLAGIGNSGGDISVELSRHAKQVYLSTKRGTWVFPRMGDGGYPADLFAGRRIWSIIPKRIMSSFAEKVANERFDHKKFGLQPDHGVFEQHPMVNDDLPIRIMTGKLKIKPNVKLIKKTSRLFEIGIYLSYNQFAFFQCCFLVCIIFSTLPCINV